MDIFLSYSWKNENVADILDIWFKTRNIILQRDVRDVEYRNSIKEFMKKVRKSDYVLLVISESYLKSANCMFELTEFLKDDDYRKRWLPLVHEDTSIFTESGRIRYIRYWQDEYKKLLDEMQHLNELNKTSAIGELRKLEAIQRMMPEFLTIISDVKIITFKDNLSNDDFEKIYYEIFPEKKQLNQNEISKEGYYILNVPHTMRGNIMSWWAEDNHSYTFDIRSARLFSKKEVNQYIANDYEAKRFSAIPARDILKINQTILPFTDEYTSTIEKNRGNIIGNKWMILSEEEIRIYR
ncbi:hypothetical protein D3C75_530790 [compost metagenome]